MSIMARDDVFGRQFHHEQLEVFTDAETGLVGVIAIHSARLGPAAVLRLSRYSNLEGAIVDPLRLSGAMTCKHAAGGLDVGGGNAGLIDDGQWTGLQRADAAFGRVLGRPGGRYMTGGIVPTPAVLREA